MHARVWVDIDEAECRNRRMRTAPVPMWNFDEHIWPHHTEYHNRVLIQTPSQQQQHTRTAPVVLDARAEPASVALMAQRHIKASIPDLEQRWKADASTAFMP